MRGCEYGSLLIRVLVCRISRSSDIYCWQNHDLDFGVAQFRHLKNQCKFPWLLANVLDPSLGEDQPLGGCEKTVILEASNGIKVGIIGLGEREWYVRGMFLPLFISIVYVRN